MREARRSQTGGSLGNRLNSGPRRRDDATVYDIPITGDMIRLGRYKRLLKFVLEARTVNGHGEKKGRA